MRICGFGRRGEKLKTFKYHQAFKPDIFIKFNRNNIFMEMKLCISLYQNAFNWNSLGKCLWSRSRLWLNVYKERESSSLSLSTASMVQLNVLYMLQCSENSRRQQCFGKCARLCHPIERLITEVNCHCSSRIQRNLSLSHTKVRSHTFVAIIC